LGTACLKELPDNAELWVGYQTHGPSSDLSFALFASRGVARTWVLSGSPHMRRGSREHALFTVAQYGEGSSRLWVACHRAKTGASFDAAIDAPLPEPDLASQYEVVLTATFAHVIHGSVRSSPGLSEHELGDVVEREFPHLAAYKGMLIDANWRLDDFTEVPPPSLRESGQERG
jgi:hypothetical protein